MDNSAKKFVFALDSCRHLGGMIWYGDLPKGAIDLFDIEYSQSKNYYVVSDVYVELKPQYEAFNPKFNKENK